VSIKEEQFAYLLVDVAEEGRDLYDGLDKVFDESEVEVENGKACRRVGLVELPPILQIQLQVRGYTASRLWRSFCRLKVSCVRAFVESSIRSENTYGLQVQCASEIRRAALDGSLLGARLGRPGRPGKTD
jgi:hypothetical protein